MGKGTGTEMVRDFPLTPQPISLVSTRDFPVNPVCNCRDKMRLEDLMNFGRTFYKNIFFSEGYDLLFYFNSLSQLALNTWNLNACTNSWTGKMRW
jgi:hypothetical protein